MFTERVSSHEIPLVDSGIIASLSVCLSVCLSVQDMKGHCMKCLTDVGAPPAMSNVSNVRRHITALSAGGLSIGYLSPLMQRCHSNGAVYITPLLDVFTR